VDSPRHSHWFDVLFLEFYGETPGARPIDHDLDRLVPIDLRPGKPCEGVSENRFDVDNRPATPYFRFEIVNYRFRKTHDVHPTL